MNDLSSKVIALGVGPHCRSITPGFYNMRYVNAPGRESEGTVGTLLVAEPMQEGHSHQRA